MMMMTDNRLLFEILHRRTAHVQCLLESEHLQSRCTRRAGRIIGVSSVAELTVEIVRADPRDKARRQ